MLFSSTKVNSHTLADGAKHQQATTSATYLGNEALMISDGSNKILFDPFFHNNFGIYQFVPTEISSAIMKGEAPYNDVSAVFISHAHDDHFSASEVLQFLKSHQQVKLIAPEQAIKKLLAEIKEPTIKAQLAKRTYSINLALGDKPWQQKIAGLHIDAVRIPHAGWPGRANIENLVYRVGFASGKVVMHMGDADPDDDHFRPYKAHWQQRLTNTAFPPYWFFYSMEGNDILVEHINAKHHIGVHVPMAVPKELKNSGKRYFSHPGQQVTIEN